MFSQLSWTLPFHARRVQFAPLILVVSLVTISLMTPTAFGQKMDQWTNSTGDKTVEAEFVKLEGVKLTLRRADGKEMFMPLSKLDDKSRLKARAMAKSSGDDSSSTDASSTASSKGSKSSPAKSSGPVSFPSNPSAQEFMDIIIRELKDDNLIVIWDAMPASKQKQIQDLVKLASTRIEQKTLNLIKKFRGDLLLALKSKKQFVLNSKALRIPSDQKPMLTKSYDALVSMIEASVPIEWMDVSYLQNSDMRDLLSGYMNNVANKFNALQNSLPSDSPFRTITPKPESASVESISSTTADVTFVLPGTPSTPVKFVLSEGRWLPEAVVTQWDDTMVKATSVLQAVNPKQLHTQVGSALLFANGLLGALSTAETQEEFDERIGELMGMAGMPR